MVPRSKEAREHRTERTFSVREYGADRPTPELGFQAVAFVENTLTRSYVPFLTAEWRHLAMINYEIEPARLQALVPRGTDLDLFQGRAYVSMVGFMFLKTRILGVPVPFHRNFEEVNLRFYVRRRHADGDRRGVSFVKEIVPLPAIAIIARAVYNEPYVRLPMQHRLDGGATYSWRLGAHWNSLAVTAEGDPQPLAPGSEEEFIAEHYWGYCAQRDGGTIEYHVEHPPWRVWKATSALLDIDATTLYGPLFAEVLAKDPVSAFLAEGSAVSVHQGIRLQKGDR